MTVEDANGNRAEMTYDGFDRQKRWIFPSTGAPGKPPLGQADPSDYEEYSYDLAGNRTSSRKRDGSTLTYAYDNLNRVIRKTVPERSGLTAAQTRDVYYDYNNAMGLQTKARFDGLDGEGVTNYYDLFGQPTTTLLAMGGSARYVSYYHDDAGNRTQITHPDGATFGYDYDPLGRMTIAHDKGVATSLDDYVIRYWYNPTGTRYAAVRGAGSGGFTTISYYDPLNRPSAIINDLPVAGADVSFGLVYNAAGQIVSRSVSNDAYAAPPAYNVSRGYQVNGLNQYGGTSSGGVVTASYQYDPNGNLTLSASGANGTTSYVYDVENRLVSASGATSATLVYDPLGRLFSVSSAATGTTQFLYDGDRMIAEYDGSGTMLKRYVHGPGADEPVAVYEGPTLGLANRRYMLSDQQGSIAALVNADGTPSKVNSYDPWGFPRAGNEGRFQYTGQAWIPELFLYYYKARFYAPVLGRFMQTDPVGYQGGINIYAYVGNDPVNNQDPTGLDCTGSKLDCGGGISPGLSGSSTASITGRPATDISKYEQRLRRETPLDAYRARRPIESTRNPTPPKAGTWNPLTAIRRAREIADEELARTRRIAPNGGHNDVYDAERHARWTYRMTNELGPRWADTFSGSHELLEEINAHPQDSREYFMDTHNNIIGINAARAGQAVPNIHTPGLIYMKGDGEYYAN